MPEVKNLITDLDLVEYGYDREENYFREYLSSGTSLPGRFSDFLKTIRGDAVSCSYCGLAAVCSYVTISPFRVDLEQSFSGSNVVKGRFPPVTGEGRQPLQAFGARFNSLPRVRFNPYANFFDTLPEFTQLNLFQDESS